MRQSEFFRWKYFPLIAQTRQIIISPPIICLNNASWFDHGLDKSSEAFSRSVSQMLKANPPHSFRRFIFNADSDQRLAFSAPTAFATLTPSNVRFVHLNATTEPITPQPHHRSSQLVQPLPRSFIATRLKNTGQPKGVGTIFLGGDMSHHSKPQAQRFVGSVENSTGRYRFFEPRIGDNATDHALFAMLRWNHNLGIQNHSANADWPDNPSKPPQWKIAYRRLPMSQDSLPFQYTISCSHLSQPDTPVKFILRKPLPLKNRWGRSILPESRTRASWPSIRTRG